MFCQDCHVCQAYKPEYRRLPGKLQQTIVHRPWEMLGMDLMAPFPRSSNQNVYLLVFVDYYTRWVELFLLRTATTDSISRVLVKDILTRWGIPDYLLSDLGPQFVLTIFQALCWTWNVGHKMTSAYHPQTNLTERAESHLEDHGCLICRKSTQAVGQIPARVPVRHQLCNSGVHWRFPG